jgi:hypothetical protein
MGIYQHYLHYKCHCLMINPNKFTILKLLIFYHMNLKYLCNLWEPFKLLLACLHVFLNSFDDPCPFCKYDLLEK